MAREPADGNRGEGNKKAEDRPVRTAPDFFPFGIRLNRWGDRAVRRRLAKVDGAYLRCYACGGAATVGAAEPFSPVADREHWPELDCTITPGCPGQLVPEVLN
jgi:hypothetical protein